MDLDQGKLFIGGISWETTEERMKDYFGKYGEVVQAVIMKDKVTNKPRGFGFVAFADPSILDSVLQDQHVLDGRTVEAKRAMSREEHQNSARSAKTNSGRNMGGAPGGYIRTKKIFVGGLPPTLTEEGFRQYFETYGKVTDVVVMYDQSTQRPRGFGFITFDSEDAVDHVLQKNFHDLNGKSVEVKRALPRDSNPNVGGGGGGGGRSSGGGSFQSYGGPNANSGSYDGRMDTNRYMQPQSQPGGVGFPGYGGPGYGYGAMGNMAYGGYSMGGYAGANAGYGAPAFGNPNASAGGFGGGPGVPRSPWANQTAAYSAASHGGNAAYESAGSWVSPGGAGPGVPTAQSPSGSGYASHGYGYGGYVNTDGSHGNQGGYGAVGGRGGSAGPPASVGSGGQHAGPASGYVGGNYVDTNGGSRYPKSWRSDPSQGAGYGAGQANGPAAGQANYGGYGASQPQQ